jgi:hypothetical protein
MSKRVKVWVEMQAAKVALYEVPPTVLKRLLKAIEDYEVKPKKEKVAKK